MKKKLMRKKLVYDLRIIRHYYGAVENMPILQNSSFSYSVSDAGSIVQYYDRNHMYVGQDASCIGPYGESDFWTVDDKGHYVAIDPPEVDYTVYEDRLYNVIVVRSYN